MFRITNVLSAFALTVGVASGAHAASYTFTTDQSHFTPGTYNQGWWSNTLGNGNTNQNVKAGGVTNFQTRNFFTFDLSSMSLAPNEKIVHAAFYGETDKVKVAGGPFETYALYDVSTDAATLNNNVGVNLAIYDDLGTGDSYGSQNFFATDNSYFLMELNEFAFEDLMTAQGGYFSLGGALLTLGNTGVGEHVFGSSGEKPFYLDIETQISAVPLPAAFPLYGAGLAVMGFIGWRKHRKATA